MNPQNVLARAATSGGTEIRRDNGRLEGTVVETSQLANRQLDQMFDLMAAHYEHMRRDQFDSDLGEKQWVILVEDADHRNVLGFSTQRLLRVAASNGKMVRALFSGDTIVQRDFWGRNPLNRLWGTFALSLMDRFPGEDLYWFLISKGYKTYRMLPVFFHEFYPRYDLPTPPAIHDLIVALGRAKFGSRFDAQRGLVPTNGDSCRLRPGVADLTPERLHDPHVAYFQQCNPRHAMGDELCCLAPLTRENFTPAAYRVMASDG
jgi:hypothetical protein